MAANSHSLDLERASLQYAWKDEPTGLDLTGDMTMECYIKTETLDASDFLILHAGDLSSETEANNQLYGIWLAADGKINTGHESGTGTNNNVVTGSAYVTNGAWIHIAIARDTTAKNYLIYTDGILRETLAYTNNPTGGSTADFQVGVALDTGGNVYYDGLIDEVRVWNTLRDATQISANYQADVTGQSGLVGYWKLNNDYVDVTGNNDLTASGSPVFSTDVPFANYAEVGGGLDLTSKYW